MMLHTNMYSGSEVLQLLVVCFQKLDKTGYAQAADLHFTPVLHYIKTFVEQEPLMLYIHLLCITLAGFLWPLQVGH